MSATHIVVEGTLKPDGSLEVAGKLGLPPGRVRVTIELLDEPPSSSSGEDWFEYLQRARAEMESAAAGFRTREAIDAEINAMRDEGDRPWAACRDGCHAHDFMSMVTSAGRRGGPLTPPFPTRSGTAPRPPS